MIPASKNKTNFPRMSVFSIPTPAIVIGTWENCELWPACDYYLFEYPRLKRAGDVILGRAGGDGQVVAEDEPLLHQRGTWQATLPGRVLVESALICRRSPALDGFGELRKAMARFGTFGVDGFADGTSWCDSDLWRTGRLVRYLFWRHARIFSSAQVASAPRKGMVGGLV